jgi:hypothetical protein
MKGKLIRQDGEGTTLGTFVPDARGSKFPSGIVVARWEPSLTIYNDGSLRGTGARGDPDPQRAERVRAYEPGKHQVNRRELLGF